MMVVVRWFAMGPKEVKHCDEANYAVQDGERWGGQGEPAAGGGRLQSSCAFAQQIADELGKSPRYGW